MKSNTRKLARLRRVHEALKPQADTTQTRLTISGEHSQESSAAANGFGLGILPFAINPPIGEADAGVALTTGLPADLELPKDGQADKRSIREVYDAKFVQFVTILEEFDLEVQQSFHELRTHCANLSETTHQIVVTTSKSEEKNLVEFRQLYEAIQNSATLQQEILSDMFMAIDTKIGELTSNFTTRTDELVKTIDSDRREAVSNLQEEMRALEARSIARVKELSDSLESRMTQNDEKAGN